MTRNALLALLLLAGCSDGVQPVAVREPAAPAAPPAVLAALTCRAEVAARRVSCEPATPATGGARGALVTVGGQHHYARLISGAVSFNESDSILAFPVAVQNLLLAPLATEDGTAPHVDGVRVFFHTGPSGAATVENASGTAAFTAMAQPYFAYAGTDLGADGILSPDEGSAPKEWRLATHGEANVTFSVYVQGHHPAALAPTGRFVRVTAAAWHSCGVTDEGRGYCWGWDIFGELGNGTTLTGARGVPSPVAMPGEVRFTTISTGNTHSCALGTNGRGYCWGDDSFGQLGNGATPGFQPSPSPVSMPAGVTFTSINAGHNHTCAVATDGRGYCWGFDASGQLGNGAVSGNQVSPSPVSMPAGVTFTSIGAGQTHSCALGANGRGYCWGSDASGQLGNGSAAAQITPSPVSMPAGVTFASIGAGQNHSCAVATSGRGYCWGQDSYGQLGNGATSGNQASPSAVAMPAGVNLTTVMPGYRHSCATSTAELYCWGTNENRQVGDGTAVNRTVPVVVAGSR